MKHITGPKSSLFTKVNGIKRKVTVAEDNRADEARNAAIIGVCGSGPVPIRRCQSDDDQSK